MLFYRLIRVNAMTDMASSQKKKNTSCIRPIFFIRSVGVIFKYLIRWHVRSTMIPLNPLSNNNEGDMVVFLSGTENRIQKVSVLR